jgi:hypothetical protein
MPKLCKSFISFQAVNSRRKLSIFLLKKPLGIAYNGGRRIYYLAMIILVVELTWKYLDWAA